MHAGPGPILSEVMADPAAVSDAQGEFIEIGNPSPDSLRLDTLRIESAAPGTSGASSGSQGLTLAGVKLGPRGCFLVCRDSLAAENGGMACDRRWPALSLANGRAVELVLSWSGGRAVFAVPASRPGVSWENTWNVAADFRGFEPSASSWQGGDSATPGSRNSRSILKPERNLGIVEVTWSRSAGTGADAHSTASGTRVGSEGFLEARIADRGTAGPVTTFLSLRLDADWDGKAETLLDSVPVAVPVGGEARIRIGAGSGVRGIVHAELGRDENPSDNRFILPVEPGRPLEITEWRPAPAPGEPEWAEIRNRTADSGGIARRLDLGYAAFNGLPLGSKAGTLEPGEFLVVTESAERFRSRFGPIKARVLQPSGWRPLRNTGDTLVLSLAGIAVDSVIYPAVTGAETASPGTPGFSARAEGGDAWKLSGKVAGPGRTLDVEVVTASGGSYALRIFDLEGNLVKMLGTGGAGRRAHSWDGNGDGGRLNPGPYILCLSRSDGSAFRAAVIVMDTP
ncbi:MAG: hypothetical protein ABIW76_07170 [Fibrobacteria bacterium]